MQKISEQIGARIKKIRTNKGMSQAQVADACGWSGAPRLANYESGSRTLGPEDAVQLAKALGVTPSELMFGDMQGSDSWLDQRHRALIHLFDQLPEDEKERFLVNLETRLKELDEYVEKYLRGRFVKKNQ